MGYWLSNRKLHFPRSTHGTLNISDFSTALKLRYSIYTDVSIGLNGFPQQCFLVCYTTEIYGPHGSVFNDFSVVLKLSMRSADSGIQQVQRIAQTSSPLNLVTEGGAR